MHIWDTGNLGGVLKIVRGCHLGGRGHEISGYFLRSVNVFTMTLYNSFPWKL